ncbi:hypothetical protein H6784_05620 [Candidatus Nomurabacteria bacterium]|nr:hypothetical protein [Candidatus Kaiserbacteria bacterium]MCB9814855.1 hypothetical protein [Candidatus Nomurabacteria bacterium]
MDPESIVDQETANNTISTTQKHLLPLVSWSIVALLALVTIGLALFYNSTLRTQEIKPSDFVMDPIVNKEPVKKLTPADIEKAMNEPLSEDGRVSHSTGETAELESVMNQPLPAGERNIYTAEEVRAAMEQ